MSVLKTTCCIAGGGPAGMMAGYLLARAGVDVVVLEKHVDFLRDFRGDTIHPSTLEVMHELGLLEEFLKEPHQKTYQLRGMISGHPVSIADFRHVPAKCKFIAFLPQWDFLDFIAGKAKAYPNFRLMMQAEAYDLIETDGVVTGVKVRTPEGETDIHAELVVGADGRRSVLRERAGLHVMDLGAPMDVLWMRITRKAGDPEQLLGVFDRGKIVALIDRGDYWQCAYAIPKGNIEKIKARGLDDFRRDVARLVPFLADRVGDLKSWDDIKLLTVAVDRLRQWWKPGLLFIGDAAHAMSPLGGVGINLAIQDAVAVGNILSAPLREYRLAVKDLQALQKRREWPARMTQGLQVFIQKNVIERLLVGEGGSLKLPWQLKLLQMFPILQRIPAYIVGIGFRPEHMKNKSG